MSGERFPDGYSYYVVEHAFLVRINGGTNERLTADGEWVDYPDRWRVLSEGRLLDGPPAAEEALRRLDE